MHGLQLLASWVAHGTSQEGWLECPENVSKPVKLAQKSLEQGQVLLRLQTSTELPSPLEDFFPSPELVATVGWLMPDPSHLFKAINVVQSVAPGEVAVQLTVDAENVWFKTLVGLVQD